LIPPTIEYDESRLNVSLSDVSLAVVEHHAHRQEEYPHLEVLGFVDSSQS